MVTDGSHSSTFSACLAYTRPTLSTYGARGPPHSPGTYSIPEFRPCRLQFSNTCRAVAYVVNPETLFSGKNFITKRFISHSKEEYLQNTIFKIPIDRLWGIFLVSIHN